MEKFILVLILLNICHWACDYTQLSTLEMLKAKKFGTPVKPIIQHSTRHGACMMMVSLLFNYQTTIPVLILTIELLSHLIIDILKGRMNKWYPSIQNPANVYHWWIFGADQFLHQVVIIILAYIIITF